MADDQHGRTSSCRRSTPPSGTPPATASSTRRERTPVRPWASRVEATGRTVSLVPIQFLWFAPRLGVAWDVNGDGKMAIRAGIGRFYQRERVSPGLGVGTNPPFSGTAAVTRTLDSAAPVTGDAAPGYGAPANALEQEAANANYWQWNVAVEQELFRNTVVELAYVGSKGLDLFGQTNLNEVPPREPPGLRADRQRGAPAAQRHRRHRRRRPGPLAAQPRLDLPLACRSRSSAGSATARCSRSRTPGPSCIANTGRGQRRRPGSQQQQRLHRQHPAEPRPGAGRERPHPHRSTRASSWPCRRCEDKSRLREERPRRLGVHHHRPGGHGLSRSRSPAAASRGSPGTARRGHGHRRQLADGRTWSRASPAP